MTLAPGGAGRLPAPRPPARPGSRLRAAAWPRGARGAGGRGGGGRSPRSGLPPRTVPFQPHVTLARVRDPWPASAVESFRTGRRRVELPPWPVRSCVLFESRLEPSGAVHTPLRTFAFAGRAPRSAHERDGGRARRRRRTCSGRSPSRSSSCGSDGQGHPRRGLRQRRARPTSCAPTARGWASPSRCSTSPRAPLAVLLVRSVTADPRYAAAAAFAADPRARLPDLLRVSRRQGRRDGGRRLPRPRALADPRLRRRSSCSSSRVTRYVSLGSVVAMVLLPPVAGLLFHAPRPVVARGRGHGRADRPQAPRQPASGSRRDESASWGRSEGRDSRRGVLGHGARDRVRALRARRPSLGPRSGGRGAHRGRRPAPAAARRAIRSRRRRRPRRTSAKPSRSARRSSSPFRARRCVRCSSLSPASDGRGISGSSRRPRASSPTRCGACRRSCASATRTPPSPRSPGRRSPRESRRATRRPPSSRPATTASPRSSSPRSRARASASTARTTSWASSSRGR